MAKNKYTVNYLSSFSDELNEIVYYITFILKNKNATERLLDNVYYAIEKRSESPESYETYKGNFDMKFDWYRIYVGNFTVFYTIRNNAMEIAHILYSTRNIDALI